MAWFAFCMITAYSWGRVAWSFSQHTVFVLYDPADELQGFVAIILLGLDQRFVEDHTYQIGCRGVLEIGDEMAGRFEAGLSFGFAADIGGLQGEIDAPCRRVGLVWRHDLFAEQEAGF